MFEENYSWKEGKFIVQPIKRGIDHRKEITTEELKTNTHLITTLTVYEHIPDDIDLLADSLLSLKLTKMTYRLESEIHRLVKWAR